MLRVLAERPAAGSLPAFRLGGGPGLSNMRFVCPPALDGRDVVLLGYRGVDGSVRLDGPEVARALRRSYGDVLGAPSRRRVAEAAAKAARRLEQGGANLAGYTVAEVLADIEDLRAALGYDRIDLLSESYGTRLACMRRPTRSGCTGRCCWG